MDKCDVNIIHKDIVKQVKDEALPTHEMEKACGLFKLLADPTRLQILAALLVSELCVCDIANVTGKTQSSISHQLRTLREGGLIQGRKDGKIVFYSLADDHVRTLLEQGMLHAQHI